MGRLHAAVKERVVRPEEVVYFDHEQFTQLVHCPGLARLPRPLQQAVLQLWRDFSQQAYQAELAYLDQNLLVLRIREALSHAPAEDREFAPFVNKGLGQQLQQLLDELLLQLEHAQEQLLCLTQIDQKYTQESVPPRLALPAPDNFQGFEERLLYHKLIEVASPSLRLLQPPALAPPQAYLQEGLPDSSDSERAYALGRRLALARLLAIEVPGWSIAPKSKNELVS